MKRTFVGFGFGPIQAGLFLLEAADTGQFDRLVVAEVAADVVAAIRGAGGRFSINVAGPDGVVQREVTGVDIYNPNDPLERERLVEAIAEAGELATALPSVRIYGGQSPAAPAALLAEGLRRKAAANGPRALLYAAENDIEAAQKLERALRAAKAPEGWMACLNTVIGKMSAVVSGRETLSADGLAPIVDGGDRAFRVEAFNRVLVSPNPWPALSRALTVFDEKPDLAPFEAAKLYGHNAAHALLGYRLESAGYEWMSDARQDPDLMAFVRDAFLEEAGKALCRRYAGADALFTTTGFAGYVDDLMKRMTNPHLRDSVERITRDPQRKLGWDDRLIGTIRLALAEHVDPRRFVQGAALALKRLARESGTDPETCLRDRWRDEAPPDGTERETVETLLRNAL